MLILNGENWEIIPYTAEFKVSQPAMTKEGYPPDTVFTENKLTSEQQAKLDELNELVDKNISIEEATEFVFNPEPLDQRTEEEKLIEIIIELDPTKVEDETIQNNIRDWEPNTAYGRFVFVRDEGVIYKTIHPIRTFEVGKPKDRPELYSRVGAEQEDGTVAVEEWRKPEGPYEAYKIGDKVTWKGQTWISKLGDADGLNSWEPGVYGWEVVK